METGDSATALGLAANNGGGGFSCTTTPAHVTNGIATFSGCSYTVASASAYTLTASSGALTPATATTTVTPGTSKKLVFTTAPPSSTTAGTSFGVVVAEEDTFGNIEAADSATALSLAGGGGGFTCTTTPAHVTNGVATFSGCSYTVASASAYTLTASSGALTPATATTTVGPGAAAKLVYTTAPPASTTAGATFTVVVAEQDAFGNVETGDSATSLALAANHGGGGFACSSTPTHVTSGVATYTGCSYTKSIGSPFTLTATSGALTQATATTTVTHAAASQVGFTTAPQTFVKGAGANTGSGTITVQAQDAFGNPVPAPAGGYAVTLTSTTAGTATFAPVSPLTIAAGTSSASFTYHDTVAGSPTLTAKIAALANPTATQTETVVSTVGTMTVTFSAQGPNPVAAGSTATYTVTIQNQTGARHDFAITNVSGLPAGATSSIGPPTCVSISGFGGATGTLTLTIPTAATTPGGTDALSIGVTAYTSTGGTCTGGTVAVGQGNANLVVTATAAQLSFVQQPSNVVHNVTMAPAITVLAVDDNFDPVVGVSITLALGTGGGTLSGGGATSTSASGLATFGNIRISVAGGGDTITASASGLTTITSGTFNVT